MNLTRWNPWTYRHEPILLGDETVAKQVPGNPQYHRFIRIDAAVQCVQYDPAGPKIKELRYVTGAHPFVQTPRGNLTVLPGDWIIVSEHQVCVCPAEWFELVFKPADNFSSELKAQDQAK